MSKTGGNAIRLKLTNLQPASKYLQKKNKGKVRSTCNQGCGTKRQISGSGSSSRHPNFWLRIRRQPLKVLVLAPAPERFGPLKTNNYWIISTTGLLHKLCLWNGNSNFRLRFHHSKVFGSGSTALVGTNCFWKWMALFLQMQLHSFCLFVFLC